MHARPRLVDPGPGLQPRPRLLHSSTCAADVWYIPLTHEDYGLLAETCAQKHFLATGGMYSGGRFELHSKHGLGSGNGKATRPYDATVVYLAFTLGEPTEKAKEDATSKLQFATCRSGKVGRRRQQEEDVTEICKDLQLQSRLQQVEAR